MDKSQEQAICSVSSRCGAICQSSTVSSQQLSLEIAESWTVYSLLVINLLKLLVINATI